MTVRHEGGAVEFSPAVPRPGHVDAVQVALARDRGRIESEKTTTKVRSDSNADAREPGGDDAGHRGLMNKQIAGEIASAR